MLSVHLRFTRKCIFFRNDVKNGVNWLYEGSTGIPNWNTVPLTTSAAKPPCCTRFPWSKKDVISLQFILPLSGHAIWLIRNSMHSRFWSVPSCPINPAISYICNSSLLRLNVDDKSKVQTLVHALVLVWKLETAKLSVRCWPIRTSVFRYLLCHYRDQRVPTWYSLYLLVKILACCSMFYWPKALYRYGATENIHESKEVIRIRCVYFCFILEHIC